MKRLGKFLTNTVAGGGGPTYSAEATAYFAAMSVQPSTALKDLVEALITTLKADDVWNYLLWLGLGPMHDAQAARVNLKTPAQVASAVNSPTFTAKQGYAGDGATSYLDTGIAGTALTDTDTSLFAIVRTNGSVLRSIAGYRNGRHQLQQGAASKSNCRVMTNTVTSTALTNSGSGQFLCASRTGTTQTLQVNTTVEDTDTVATDTLSNTNTIKFLADAVSYSDAQLESYGFGLHLNNTRASALKAALDTFNTAAEAL